ncbi:type III secretion system inner rod subunit SctI [Chromobacterium vaccinii]|uniref:type III secretion system inner rod subunit SctI n=1 Tax=Chromobacterium vaccinii TaxID=1108595 RepID=UPI001E425ACC|nr:type III secretion system inner rod subunit SctI [Chromobacterium vaccinii]MCD4484627.1 type III secretion system inner rod subunit SctI [Chromobacterium vaccinii]
MTPISAAQSRQAIQVSDISQTDQQTMSLEDRMIHAFAESAVSVGTEKTAIMQKIDQPEDLSDPSKLYQLQLRTSNYNLEVSMLSTLARKGVGVVESLLRS